MRRVARHPIDPGAQEDLGVRQAAVAQKCNAPGFSAADEWKAARPTATLGAVLTSLRRMMGDRQRCMYCLDSHGTDIEHFWPKTPYPERMFVWLNLLLCCAECGRFKGDRFPLADGMPLDVLTSRQAKAHQKKLLPDRVEPFATPKTEQLLGRIVEMLTEPGDWVLDPFAGSGTTGAVAHKMGRRWIMVELGEHCHTHIIPRMKKVIDGEDPGGITEAVGWKGVGGFRYYRLAPSLLEKDKWGNWVVNKQYNPAMLMELE